MPCFVEASVLQAASLVSGRRGMCMTSERLDSIPGDTLPSFIAASHSARGQVKSKQRHGPTPQRQPADAALGARLPSSRKFSCPRSPPPPRHR